MRARVNAQMDPDSKQGLAKPYYDKLIELIAPKAEKDASDKARLVEAYRYNIAYFFIVKEDKAQAKEFANKLIAIDPDNEVGRKTRLRLRSLPTSSSPSILTMRLPSRFSE